MPFYCDGINFKKLILMDLHSKYLFEKKIKSNTIVIFVTITMFKVILK